MNIEEARSAFEKLEDYLLSRDCPVDVRIGWKPWQPLLSSWSWLTLN